MMNVGWSEKRDAAMAVLVVVRANEGPHERSRGGDVREVCGELGRVFGCLEERFDMRVVVGNVRP